MQEKTKLACIILSVFLFYAGFGIFNFLNYGIVNNGSDFEFHWQKLQGNNDRKYSPAYYFLFFPFKFNQVLFYLANLAIIVGLIPFLIFKLAKTVWAVLAYFSAVPLPHMILFGATYPEAIVLALILAYFLNRKNWLLLLTLASIAFFLHSKGLHIFLAIFALEIAELLAVKAKLLAIAPITYINPVVLNLKTTYINPVVLNLKTALETFLFQLPLGFLIFAFQKMRGIFYPGLVFISILASFADIRTLSIAQLIVCVYLGIYLKESNWKIRAPIILAMGFYSVFFAINFIYGTWQMN